MFKSFFPQPKWFFLSAIIWGLMAVLLWEMGGKTALLHQFQFSDKVPISVTRFWSGSFFLFYVYYLLCVGLFSAAWMLISPHRWQIWSILGSALIIFITWFQVEVGVAINAWYHPFYDLIQQSLSKPGSINISKFYLGLLTFLWIALAYVIVGVLSGFFVSHYVFRWRTAMNNYYMANWQRLSHIEGAAQRVQEDTMRFANTMEGLGVQLLNSIMTLIAFLPVLVALSPHVKNLPVVGALPYGLVLAGIIWSLAGTVLLASVGIKLPGLEFNNQRVEAAYRKELVYGEDNENYATPQRASELFSAIRKNYFRLYFHYLYFNVTRFVFLQLDTVFGLFLLFPSIVSGALTLGLMTQIMNVFGQVRSAFQYLISSWPTMIELLSIYKRLRSFEQQLNVTDNASPPIVNYLPEK